MGLLQQIYVLLQGLYPPAPYEALNSDSSLFLPSSSATAVYCPAVHKPTSLSNNSSIVLFKVIIQSRTSCVSSVLSYIILCNTCKMYEWSLRRCDQHAIHSHCLKILGWYFFWRYFRSGRRASQINVWKCCIHYGIILNHNWPLASPCDHFNLGSARYWCLFIWYISIRVLISTRFLPSYSYKCLQILTELTPFSHEGG